MISRWLSSEEACSARPFDAEGQYAAETVGQVLLGQIVERTALQTGIVYALDLGVLLEPLGHFERIVHRSLYAQREGFESLQQQEGVERTLAGAVSRSTSHRARTAKAWSPQFSQKLNP